MAKHTVGEHNQDITSLKSFFTIFYHILPILPVKNPDFLPQKYFTGKFTSLATPIRAITLD